uniref:Uncharacterized protein n=1 Tax=Oryza nivara TaxID=4536 RepID=A0A0E0GDK4_ORYNI
MVWVWTRNRGRKPCRAIWLANNSNAHTPFLSLPYSPGENLASVSNERWRRSTSHPPWGHRFGETFLCKDIVIGLCIGFELQS